MRDETRSSWRCLIAAAKQNPVPVLIFFWWVAFWSCKMENFHHRVCLHRVNNVFFLVFQWWVWLFMACFWIFSFWVCWFFIIFLIPPGSAFDSMNVGFGWSWKSAISGALKHLGFLLSRNPDWIMITDLGFFVFFSITWCLWSVVRALFEESRYFLYMIIGLFFHQSGSLQTISDSVSGLV